MGELANVPPVQNAAALSARGSIAITFPKSRSASFEMGLAAARLAENYAEGLIGSSFLHCAGFGVSRDQLANALVAVRNLHRIAGFQAFGRGSIIRESFKIERVLECYLTASACSDPRAHCVVVVEEERLYTRQREPVQMTVSISLGSTPKPRPDTFGLNKVGMREFPCRFMHQWGFRYQKEHPSGEPEQLQAAALRLGCEWCPLLQPALPALKL